MTDRANDPSLAQLLGARRRALEAGEDGPSDSCLSDLTLDRLLLPEGSAELTAELRAAAERHLAGCAKCTEARAALAADHMQFQRDSNLGALAADALARAGVPAGHRSPWRRWLWLRWAPALGLGAALAAAFVLVPRRTVRDAGDLRAKGGLSVALYVKRAGTAPDAPGDLHMGEPLQPGDRVRLQLTSDRDGDLTILGLDTTGKLHVYKPPGPHLWSVKPGHEAVTTTSGAIELDDTLGKEVIVALRCQERRPLEQLLGAVQRAVDASKVASDPPAALGQPDLPCAQARYVITKTAKR